MYFYFIATKDIRNDGSLFFERMDLLEINGSSEEATFARLAYYKKNSMFILTKFHSDATFFNFLKENIKDGGFVFIKKDDMRDNLWVESEKKGSIYSIQL